MKRSRLCLGLRLACAAALGVAILPSAQASGLSIPELSVAGLGLSNALVANPEDFGAVAYNPAALGLHARSGLTAGLVLLEPSLDVTTASGHHDSQHADILWAPDLQGSYRLTDRWTLGLGMNSPFGLESEWEVGTFPVLSTPLAAETPPGPLHPTQSKLELFSIVPAVAYRLDEGLSIAVGLDYYNLHKVDFDTAGATIRGDGDGFGWNLSMLYSAGPLSLGACYHSAATVAGKGDFMVINPVLTVLGKASQPIAADLHLPWRLQIGVGYALSERLRAELDLERTGWSEFDTVDFISRTDGSLVSRTSNYWDDSNIYRLGLTYRLSPQTRLRFGYAYNESAQTVDYFSPRTPDSDRQIFSIGVAQGFGDDWEVEAGYMYVMFDDVHYQGVRPFNPAISTDPNGTTAINGDYKAHVHIFGLGVSKVF